MNEKDREIIKERKAAKRISFIGFIKDNYKTIRFNKQEHRHLLEGAFVKFWYGLTKKKSTTTDKNGKKKHKINYVIGKVQKIERRGVHVITDCGYHAILWKRIDYFYLPKGTKMTAPAEPKRKRTKRVRTKSVEITFPIISTLVKPTDKARKAMTKLGISLKRRRTK